jgi:predicted acylesterase/phospholipase RssA
MDKFRVFLAGLVSLSLAACETNTPLRTPPPAALHERAVVASVPEARFWGDGLDPAFAAAETQRIGERFRNRWEASGRPESGVRVNVLALSGGGPDGAFAAGLLNGWSTTGTRPQFELVTGISIGALIAPFAFLGPDYDPALRSLFTEFDTSRVLIFQPFALLFGALGLIDTAPLRATIRSLVDEEMLRRVAEEHRKGRRLLIGTTNIDAGRPVVWNMGAIAEAGDVDLFGDVMLASASIPGAFPPVLIDVTADGERFTEFHVDGGVTRSVILWPDGTERLFAHVADITRSGAIYVIQNNQLLPPYQPVASSVRQIAARSLSTLIRGQTEGDLTRIYLAAQRVGYDFRLIFVPPSDAAPGTTDFDPGYMRSLFESAERIGRGTIPWLDQPPGVADRRDVQQEITAAFRARGRQAPTGIHLAQ